MNIHEHQAKAVLEEYGVAVPRGFPAFTVEEAVQAAQNLGGPVFVVKSQIHAGGRGKGKFEGLGPDAKGGVRVVKSVDDVKASAAEMLGRVLVTHQTGPKGKQVNRLYIEEGADDRQGVLPVAAGRPRRRSKRVRRRLDRGRHGHRGRGPRHAREDPHLHHRPGDRRVAEPHAATLAKALGLTGALGQGGRTSC